MLRKLSLVIVIVLGLVLMSGCNLKEKIGENISEKVVEKALGDNADVNLDGEDITVKTEDGGEFSMDGEDNITFTGEDGSVVTAGDASEWPQGQAADYVPKFDGGSVDYTLNSEKTCMINVTNTTIDDYKAYVASIMDAGYTEEKVESSATDLQIYSAKSSDGIVVTVSYLNEEATLSITVDAQGKQ